VPGSMGRDIRTKSVVESLPEDIELEMSATGRLPHVITIPFPVPLQLGKGEVMGLEREVHQAPTPEELSGGLKEERCKC
jgi:hypothetical protein